MPQYLSGDRSSVSSAKSKTVKWNAVVGPPAVRATLFGRVYLIPSGKLLPLFLVSYISLISWCLRLRLGHGLVVSFVTDDCSIRSYNNMAMARGIFLPYLLQVVAMPIHPCADTSSKWMHRALCENLLHWVSLLFGDYVGKTDFHDLWYARKSNIPSQY